MTPHDVLARLAARDDMKDALLAAVAVECGPTVDQLREMYIADVIDVETFETMLDAAFKRERR